MPNSLECQAEGMIAADLAAGLTSKTHLFLAVTLIALHVNKAMAILAMEACS